MNGIGGTIRLVAGLAMMGAGTTLAAPAGIAMWRWWQRQPAPVAAAAPFATPAVAVFAPAVPAMQAFPVPPAAAAAPATLRPDYVPPAVSTPLPPAEAALAAPGPEFGAAYRSTLRPPPPQLLDGQRPPPLAVGWTSREAAAPPVRHGQPAVPATYRVRDGDDLTGIAIRFYGRPAAAGAIWQANHHVIPDPAVLPIGLDLVLPDPALALAGPTQGASIEPAVALDR